MPNRPAGKPGENVNGSSKNSSANNLRGRTCRGSAYRAPVANRWLIAAGFLFAVAASVRGQSPAATDQPKQAPDAAAAQSKPLPAESAAASSAAKEDHAAKPFDLRSSTNLTGDWGGYRTKLKESGVNIELFYNQQFQQNFRGGRDTHNGQRFSGSYDLNLALDFGKMGWMDDAGFFIRAAKGTWSDGINPDKVGALFNVNSDAGDDHPIFINKWWFWKKFADKKVELRLGLLQTNKDLFDVSLYANHEDKDFLNRLSIRNATIAHKVGNGFFLKYEPVKWFYVQGAAIDSRQQARTTGWDTAFHGPAWFAGYSEAGFTPKWEANKGPMPGRYRIGAWYDPNTKTIYRNSLGGRRHAATNDGDTGYYIGADQMVWKETDDPKDTQGLGVFMRYGHAHADRNRVTDSWEIGASMKGLVPARDHDVMAFAVSQGIESERYRYEVRRLADRETVYEWYYGVQVTPWMTVSPDVQIITNPGGDKTARDDIVGGVRVRIIF